MDEIEALKADISRRVDKGWLVAFDDLDGSSGYVLGWQDAVAALGRLREPVGGVGIIEYGEVGDAERRSDGSREDGGTPLP